MQKQDYDDLIALIADNYALTVQGEPVLLNQREYQRVFRLSTAQGPTLALRLCPSSRPYQQVLAQAQGLLYLACHAFPAPALRLTISGQPTFEWQPGSWAYVQDFIAGVQPEWNLDTLQEVAGLLARLHRLADHSAPYPARVEWLNDLPDTIQRAEACANHPQWGHEAREVAQTLANLSSLRGLPTGLIHADVHEGNLLHTCQGGLCLLDWELAGMGELILDLAMVLGWHCFWPATKTMSGQVMPSDFDFDEAWCKTFLAAYQKTRPLSWEEAQHLGTAIRFVIGWYATRDIAREIEEVGASEGLAFFHWAILHSLTPAREKLLIEWVVATGAQL